VNYLDYIESPMCISTGRASLAVGDSAIANGAAIQSKYRGPLLINEIEFVVASVGLDAAGQRIMDFRQGIQASIMAGRLALTNGYCPIALLGPSNAVGNGIGTQAGADYTTEAGVYTPSGSATVSTVWGSTYWRFPKPLFYPPSLGFTIRYQREPTTPDAFPAVTIDCVVRGYYLRKDIYYPSEIDVPWAAGSSFRQLYDMQHQNNAPAEEIFRNPFPVPLNIQRFTARYWTQSPTTFTPVTGPSSVIFDLNDGIYDQDPYGGNPHQLAWDNITRVKMQKQSGQVLIPNAVPFWEAFDYRRQHWLVPTYLAPNDMIDIRLLNMATTQTISAQSVTRHTFIGEPQIGFIGSRKEVLT
jgi:hypothetical protein